MIGKMVEWQFDRPAYTGGAPVKASGMCHAVAHESGDDTWQDFVALVELDSGELVKIPATVAANMRVCKEG